MRLYKGSVSLPVLVAIILGIAILGGGAYYLAHKVIPSSPVIPIATTTQQAIVVPDATPVPGMSQYADKDFGFSFWYPSGWTVQATSFSAGNVSKSLVISDGSGKSLFTISELHPSGKVVKNLVDKYDAESLYFDSGSHTWIYEKSAGDKITRTAADVSRNTMGGLHMLSWGSIQPQYDLIIPLSAEDFVDVSDPSYSHDVTPLAQTILAIDLSVAMPVQEADQIKMIQAEAAAYSVSSGTFSASPLSGKAPLTVTFSDFPSTAVEESLNFGDGSPEASNGLHGWPASGQIAHTYARPGTYTAVLMGGLSVGELGRFTITVAQ